MKSEKNNEDGFLLLESLVTLGMLAAIILMIYPLIANWMTIRQETKNEVELNRILYEESYNWRPEQSLRENNNDYLLQTNENSIKIKKNKQNTEVVIYEYEFK